MERFNRTLADRLFTYQYHKELEDPSKSNREWVSRLQNVVSSLNNEKTRLNGMKPVDVIKQTLVEHGFSQPAKEYEEKLFDVGSKPIWSVDVYKIKDRYVQSINQHCTIQIVDLRDLLFSKSYSPFTILSY